MCERLTGKSRHWVDHYYVTITKRIFQCIMYIQCLITNYKYKKMFSYKCKYFFYHNWVFVCLSFCVVYSVLYMCN